MELKQVLLAHNPVRDGDDPSTSDILAQVEMVEGALRELGLPFRRVAVEGSSTLEAFRQQPRGTVVFNMIEAPSGRPYVHTDSTAVLELVGLPFTGSSPAALALTTDKLATRALLASEGIAVAEGGRLDLDRPAVLDRVPPPWILKPAYEDASVGLEGNPLCATREEALERGAALTRRFPEQPVLVERYLPGRELNVALLADGDRGIGGVEALPVSEILFQDFPEGMPKVLGYEAKWDEESFACIHTVRHFPEGPEDDGLLRKVREAAISAWHLCGLEGYARVDLRLDEAGEPRVLEVNANPCLAADAGFMAAAAKAGLSGKEVVRRILAAVRKRKEEGDLTIRQGLEAADRAPLEAVIRGTGFFNPEEIEVAIELIDDRLSLGEESHYRFLVSEIDGKVAGYACWGPIPGTTSSVDLYWIVVHPERQGQGIGAALLRAAEEWVVSSGRNRVYVETSTRVQYDPTRRFYLSCGYDLAAELPDFYAPGDGKAMFIKVLLKVLP